MGTKLPALLQQPPLISSQAHSAHSSVALAQTASVLRTTPQLLVKQDLEHAAAAKALLPVLMAMPKDCVLQLMAVRSGSPASCCISAAAAGTSPAATETAPEAATQAAGASSATTEAASLNPAETEVKTQAAPASPDAAEAVSIIPVAAEAVAAAACTPSAATDLFLSELHSTDLFQVVRHCLDKATTQPLSYQQSQDASMQKAPTAGHTLHQGQAERDQVTVSDVSHEAIPASDDRGVHPALAAASNHATSLAVASVKAPNSSTIGRDAGVPEGLCQSGAEMIDDNHQQRISQQELDRTHTKSCHVQQNPSDTAVQASCCPQVPLSVPGLSLGQSADSYASCMGKQADRTPIDVKLLIADDISPPLAEMICMLLLLVPKTVWHHACDQVRLISSGCSRVLHASGWVTSACYTVAACCVFCDAVKQCGVVLSSTVFLVGCLWMRVYWMLTDHYVCSYVPVITVLKAVNYCTVEMW